MRVLEVIAPANADVWARALLPFGEGAPRWASISLDPAASLVEALKWTVYAGVFSVASAIAGLRGATWGICLVFAAAVAAAATTMGHGLLGASRVFGLYEPTFKVAAWHVGPLLNPNNLAGYLNFGAFCGLGILLMRKPLLPHWLVGLGVTTIVAVGVTSASRAGVALLPIGLGVLALAVRLGSRGRDGLPSMVKWLVGAAIAGGVLLAYLGGTRETWADLLDKNVDKLSMVLWARPLLRDFGVLGIGRGAFESVFPAYRSGHGWGVVTHAENFPAQWSSEWGIPVALAALVAFAWAFRPSMLGVRRSAVAAAAWTGLTVLLLQNLVDLALEIPGVCIAVATATGSLWGDRARRSGGSESRSESRFANWGRRWFSQLTVGFGVAIALGALIWSRHEVSRERTSLRRRFEETPPTVEGRAEFRRELRAAMLRHPAEPYFPLLGGMVAWRARDQNPMPWLQRALERSPVNARAHLLLAEVLFARGAKGQALFELRLAVSHEPGIAASAAQLALRWTRDPDELLQAASEGLEGATLLDAIGATWPTGADQGHRGQLDEEALRRNPDLIGPRLRLSQEILAALSVGSVAERCADRARCEREIEAHAVALERAEPTTSRAAQLRARVMVANGHAGEAERLLGAVCPTVVNHSECLMARVQAAGEARDDARLNDAIKDLIAWSCTNPVTCAEVSSSVGDFRYARGDRGGALTHYVKAARNDPTEQRLLKVADVASQQGAHLQAVEALEKVLRKRGGADADLRARIERERAAAQAPLH